MEHIYKHIIDNYETQISFNDLRDLIHPNYEDYLNLYKSIYDNEFELNKNLRYFNITIEKQIFEFANKFNLSYRQNANLNYFVINK